MRSFGRRAVGNVIGMTNAERLAHIEHYRARTRELYDMERCCAAHSTEVIAKISSEIASFDRMVAILEDSIGCANTFSVRYRT